MNDSNNFKQKLMKAISFIDENFIDQSEKKANRLLNAGVNSTAQLITLITDHKVDPALRSIGCWFLARIDEKKALTVLLQCLFDENPDIRAQAAQGLGTVGDPQAVPMLIHTLEHDHDWGVRFHCIYALGLLADSEATDPILKRLSDPDEIPEVRGIAAETLSVFSPEQVAETLIKCLSDPEPEVRYWSAFSSGELGIKEAIPELRRLADHDHTVVKEAGTISQEAAEAIKLIEETT